MKEGPRTPARGTGRARVGDQECTATPCTSRPWPIYPTGYSYPEVAVIEKAQAETQVGPCVTAFRAGRVVAVNNLSTEQARWPQYCRLAASVGISAVASIPLELNGHAVGVLDLYARGRRDWPEADLSAAAVFANMATMFLINASHHRKRVELNEQLQRALDNRVVIEQAKGALAATKDITPDQAFTSLRNFARNNNRTLVEVARAVVEHGLDPVGRNVVAE